MTFPKFKPKGKLHSYTDFIHDAEPLVIFPHTVVSPFFVKKSGYILWQRKINEWMNGLADAAFFM